MRTEAKVPVRTDAGSSIEIGGRPGLAAQSAIIGNACATVLLGSGKASECITV